MAEIICEICNLKIVARRNKRFCDSCWPQHRKDKTLQSRNDNVFYLKSSVALAGMKRRAKQYGFRCEVDVKYLAILLSKAAECPCCGIELIYKVGGRRNTRTGSPSFDKIITTNGYVPGNIVIICLRCN